MTQIRKKTVIYNMVPSEFIYKLYLSALKMVSAKDRNENVLKLECLLLETSSWQISAECAPWLVGKNTILGLSILFGLFIFEFLVTKPFLN